MLLLATVVQGYRGMSKNSLCQGLLITFEKLDQKFKGNSKKNTFSKYTVDMKT